MTWIEPYDGAKHPDKPDPAAHDDIHPVAWRERLEADKAWRKANGDLAVFLLGCVVFFFLFLWIAYRLTG